MIQAEIQVLDELDKTTSSDTLTFADLEDAENFCQDNTWEFETYSITDTFEVPYYEGA